MKDKIVVLTGAAGGIGADTAHELVRCGARVALVDRDPDALARLGATLGQAAMSFACDVSDETSVAAAITAIEARFGRIDAGVLNAGIAAKRQPLQEIAVTTFDNIMAVNLRGVFLTMKHLFAPIIRAGGGSMVVTGSTESLRGNVGLSHYVASKHALVGLVKTAAMEWAAHGIRINLVNPGPVDTDMMRTLEQTMIDAGQKEVRASNTARIPMKRYAMPTEVARFIRFLLSEDASYCTGGTYLLDGGAMAGKMAQP